MNSGLIRYTGNDLTYEEIEICNGELLTDVITKIFTIVNRIKTDITLNLNIDGCLTIDTTSINTVLQDVIDYIKELKCDSTLQTQINSLSSSITVIQNFINDLNIQNTTINSPTQYSVNGGPDYQLLGFVPMNTILPYFGSFSDFDGTGKGLGNMCGWAIANGNNGTKNVCGHYIKYECEGCCNGAEGGVEQIVLSESNLPLVTPTAVLNISGNTLPAGDHIHNLHIDNGCYGANLVAGCDTSLIPSRPNHCIINTVETSPEDQLTAVQQCDLMEASGTHTHPISITGSISGISFGQANPNPLNIDPLHYKAIPIQRINTPCL